jgi:hypothetical protein
MWDKNRAMLLLIRQCLRTFTGRTSNFRNFTSMESFTCACRGRPLLNQGGYKPISLEFFSFALGGGQDLLNTRGKVRFPRRKVSYPPP